MVTHAHYKRFIIPGCGRDLCKSQPAWRCENLVWKLEFQVSRKMASAAKKGKKPKNKAVSLQSFLAKDNDSLQAGYNIVTAKRSNLDWAAEVEKEGAEEEDASYYSYSAKDQYILPSAPLGPNIDMAKLPSTPPFTAFLGNLPYDTEDADISAFFKNLKVGSIRLLRHPGENGRLRGFGYVEFEDRQSLVDALGMSENYLKSSKIKIDIAGNQDEHGRPRRDRNDRSDRPDRTGGNWRSEPREEVSKPEERERVGDRDRDRFGDSDRSRFGDSDRSRFGDRDRDRFGDKERERYGERDQERSRYGGDRDRYGSDRRGFERGSYDTRDGGERERGNYSNFGSDRDRDRDRGQRDFNGFERGGGSRGGRRDYGSGFRSDDRQGDYGRSSNFSRNAGPPSDSHSNDPGTADDAPKERPRLVLQPRTKPLSEATEPSASSAIFGGAKPVDTAAREREIEERLAKEKDLALSKAVPPLDTRSRESDRETVKDDRYDEHSDGGERTRRPPAGSQGRSPKSSVSVASGGTNSCHSETDEEKSERSVPVVSKPQSPKREEIKSVPAPLPKENAWTKRAQSMQQSTGSSKDESGQSRSAGSSDHGSPHRESSTRSWKDDPDSRRRTSDSRGRNETRGNEGDDPEESRHRSRDSGKPKELPKFEAPAAPNYASSNKFSQLYDSDDD